MSTAQPRRAGTGAVRPFKLAGMGYTDTQQQHMEGTTPSRLRGPPPARAEKNWSL
jgi:hypothetical protein